MGCASSKHRKRCRKCGGGISPVVVPRSYSMHVHHPPQYTGDSYHTVALTSSTIGSLNLCDSSLRHFHKQLEGMANNLLSDELGKNHLVSVNGFHRDDEQKDLEVKNKANLLIEAKIWSSMMNEKIPKIVPKTPIMTPPGEPEMINTWELMEGLEDLSPLKSPNHLRSFSFDVVRIKPSNDDDLFDRPKSRFHEANNGDMKSNSKFDDLGPSSFRKSLQEVPKDHLSHTKFGSSDEEQEEEEKFKKVILYFTSLRGIRKTYEDSCNVKIILKSFGIRLDERDVSMHSPFKDELKKLLKEEFKNGVGITLPRVFLGNKYLGGFEDIKKLNENGKLEKLLESCEKIEDGFTGCGNECEGCGDIRFVPCETCSGSCKIYYEDEDEEFGFQRCIDCNENGLIRCPVCCV